MKIALLLSARLEGILQMLTVATTVQMNAIIGNNYPMPNLLEGENLITSSANGSFMLTNKRVRFSDSSGGKSNVTSILLDKVASIEIGSSSQNLYIWLGLIISLVGAYVWFEESEGFGGMLLLIGVILIVVYFSTRIHQVAIVSDGGSKIEFRTSGLSKSDIVDLLDKIEEVRLKNF